jgi:hypothetical protein
MTTTTPSAALVPALPVFTNAERLALAGFLAGYSGLTREAYALDLRQFANWCHQHHLRLFGARRADIESFARDLEARGRARATVTRRLCTIAGFYRYAVEEELLDHSPATHVRRPRLGYESHPTAISLLERLLHHCGVAVTTATPNAKRETANEEEHGANNDQSRGTFSWAPARPATWPLTPTPHVGAARGPAARRAVQEASNMIRQG